jgi:hypothetical protein
MWHLLKPGLLLTVSMQGAAVIAATEICCVRTAHKYTTARSLLGTLTHSDRLKEDDGQARSADVLADPQ